MHVAPGGCARCREVVFQAQEPAESEPSPRPAADKVVPFRKRWFAPLAGLAAAAAVGILTFSIPIHREEKPTGFAPTEAAPTVRLA
jgi:hypothetical protein